MLKKISIDKKPNGKNIIIPLDISNENMEQQVKVFIEIADYNPFDGQLHITHFRLYHGKEKVINVLKEVLKELGNPSIELELRNQRKDLQPFFEDQLFRHISFEDKDFGEPADHSKLPL